MAAVGAELFHWIALLPKWGAVLLRRAGKGAPLRKTAELFCGLGGGGKNAVEAEVHGLGGVVVSPGTGEHDDGGTASHGAIGKDGEGFVEGGVIDLGECGAAEIERRFKSGNEFVFSVLIVEFGLIGRGDSADFGTDEGVE